MCFTIWICESSSPQYEMREFPVQFISRFVGYPMQALVIKLQGFITIVYLEGQTGTAYDQQGNHTTMVFPSMHTSTS